MMRLPSFTALGLFLVLGGNSLAQSVRVALYPSEDTRAAVCRAFMANPVPQEEEARLFQLEVYRDDRGSAPSVGVEVIAPMAWIARGCNRHALAGWGYTVAEMLDDPFYEPHYVWVLVGRHVHDLAYSVNHIAALVVRDAEGADTATLFPDPWQSTLLYEGPVWRSSRHPGLVEAASAFAFDLRDEPFRDAVTAGGTVVLRWKAGELDAGMWEWPAVFGDCSDDLLDTCSGVR